MIRITGGQFRGRSLRTPASDSTRPTQAKMRQALFNSLQSVVSGARVLELFAGSGALGFEALSWGAEQVVFVESSKSVARLIGENARSLGVAEQVHVLTERVEESFGRLETFDPFDLVLADPPYAEFAAHRGKACLQLLSDRHWERILRERGLFCMETVVSRELPEGLPERLEFLVKVREKKYGDSLLTTYRREAPVAAETPSAEANDDEKV